MNPRTTGVLIAGLLLAGLPAAAHHSFVMFDTTKQVKLSGVVSSFEWTNPHTYIEIDAADGEKGRKWKKDTKIEGTNSTIYGKHRT